jgi:hypothetical protein
MIPYIPSPSLKKHHTILENAVLLYRVLEASHAQCGYSPFTKLSIDISLALP